MYRYIFKRVLWFIPSLLIVTLIGFFLLAAAPGDPVNLLVSSNSAHGSMAAAGNLESQKTYWRQKLGLDRPLFYVSLTTLATPDTIYKLTPEKKARYKQFLKLYGNHSDINIYFNSLDNIALRFVKETQILSLDSNHVFLISEKEQIHNIETSLAALEFETQETSIKHLLNIISQNAPILSSDFQRTTEHLIVSYNKLLSQKTTWKNFVPKIVIHGFNNQYHQWLFGGPNSKGLIRGDFGISYHKKEPVINIIKHKIMWSVFFSLLSILLAYAISIPLGMKMAQYPNSRFTKISQNFLFALYSTPPFFAGVLLLMVFANPDVLPLFPASGIKPAEGYNDSDPLFLKVSSSLPYIILPLIVYTYSSLAFITKLTATSVSVQLKQDYVKTARAKGLNENAVVKRHALKNSLIPLITVFSSVFPSVIAGSVIIESIFGIPGMGLESVKAIISRDYPVVIVVITLTTLLTLISYLIADILYTFVDPRIKQRN